MDNKLNSIKKGISKYSFGDNPFIDDAIIKGGYRVVRTVRERNAIDCCHRKLGMRVMVIGQDFSYKDYTLKGEHPCSNDFWELNSDNSGPPIDSINDSDVILLDDYSDLDITENIETQQDLNLVLARILKSILTNQTIGDKTYVHDQFIPSTVWTIQHNLNKKPSVTVVDTAHTVVEGVVDYGDSITQLTITFNYPFSGYATLN